MKINIDPAVIKQCLTGLRLAADFGKLKAQKAQQTEPDALAHARHEGRIQAFIEMGRMIKMDEEQIDDLITTFADIHQDRVLDIDDFKGIDKAIAAESREMEAADRKAAIFRTADALREVAAAYTREPRPGCSPAEAHESKNHTVAI